MRKLLRVGSTLVLFQFLLGCATVRWELAVPLINEYGLFVEIEQLRRGDSVLDAGFAHPCQISPSKLEKLLLSLRYRSKGMFSERELPVFSPESVPRLARAIAEGLARAGPSERVRFKVVNRHTELKFIPTSRTSRGVAFVKPEGTLNLAFDLVDDSPEGQRKEELFQSEWEDPTKYTFSTCTLLLPPEARFHKDKSGKTWRLWIEVPTQLITSQTERKTQSSKVPKTKSQPARKQVSDEEKIIRLKYLRELLERKIITEEEYEKERRRIFEGY